MDTPEKHCLLSLKKSYEKRVLCSDAGKVVRETWEEIMFSKLSRCGLEENLVGTDADPVPLLL